VNGCHLDKLYHNEIWVIGNGESRKTFDLHSIDSHIIGCNAIHREFVCDQIVAVDRRMVTEIVANADYTNIPVSTRPNWIGDFTQYPNVKLLPELPYKGPERRDDPWHWNTGPFAIVIACYMNPKTVNLLGFDLYSVNNKLNNVYKDTRNYGKTKDTPVDHSYWLYHLKRIYDCFPEINFVIHNVENWQMPSEWMDTKNLTFKTISVNIHYADLGIHPAI